MELRKNRRILFLTAALLLCFFLLTACSSGGETVETEKVKVAFIGPLTGPNASSGIGGKNSFLLAIQEANESGDLDFEIEPWTLDDASNSDTAVKAAKKIVSDPDVVAVVAHWNSEPALATIDVFHRAGIPVVIWGAINKQITYGNDFKEVTRVVPIGTVENTFGAKFLINELGKKTCAVIHDTSSYGVDNAEEFTTEIEKLDGEVLAREGIQVGQRDFTAVLSKIKPLEPDVVYYGGVVAEAALLKMQMEDLGIDALFASVSGIHSEDFQELAGEAAEGTVIQYGGMPVKDLPGGQEFIQKYEAASFEEPYEAYGPYAYDAAKIVVEALKQVGPDPTALVDAIAATEYEGVLGTTTFDEYGQTENEIVTTFVSQDGKWVPWKESEYAAGTRQLQ